METAAFCFAVDLISDPPGAVLDEISMLGFDGIVLAAAYHEARDYLPHNMTNRVHYSPAGVCFEADASLYGPEMQPHPLLPVCADRDLLVGTIERARARGMFVDAWIVYLHRDGRPSEALAGRGFVENAFGDVSPVALCPASPVSRRYAVALTRDVCRRRPRSIVAEALHYLPFGHDYHHERLFLPLTGIQRTLLALCFCSCCRSAAQAADVDVERLASWVRDVVDGEVGVDCATPWNRASFCTLSGSVDDDALATYLDLREQHVSTLADLCSSVALAAGVEFRFLDLSAAVGGRATGASEGPGGVEVAWQLGVDLLAVERHCQLLVAPYVREPADMASEIAGYIELLQSPLGGVVLRPMPPDCLDTDNLIDKVRQLWEQGITHVGYYHYGMASKAVLTRISAAHRQLARQQLSS
jgi:hypothetical protein